MKHKFEQFFVRTSGIPGAGKGLFAREAIKKGSFILQYHGKATTWKNADHKDGTNPYLFYVNSRLVIDALDYPDSAGRYVNDARGIYRTKGVVNNAVYTINGKKIELHAKRNIAPGEEILAAYGKEFWDAVRYNLKLAKQAANKIISKDGVSRKG